MRYTLELNTLNNMIRQGESETLEFKKTTGQRTDAAKTICAFLKGRLHKYVATSGTTGGSQSTRRETSRKRRRNSQKASAQVSKRVVEHA